MSARCYLALFLFMLLTACTSVAPQPQEKAESKEIALVAYEGETLVVAGKRYERPTEYFPCRGGMCSPLSPLPRYQVGTILVEVGASEELQVKELIARYGLSVTQQIGSAKLGFFTFVIAVPNFFEMQWTQALSNEPGVRGAWVNAFAYILPP